MNYLIVLNDPPYGTERSYNGLRLALSLAQPQDTTVRVFVIGDGVWCAFTGQTTPSGYYNVERMIKSLARKRGQVGVCGSCMDARGIKPEFLAEGAIRSSMEQLAVWTREADKVLVF